RVKDFPEVAKEILGADVNDDNFSSRLEALVDKRKRAMSIQSVPADQRVSADKSVPADTRIPARPCVSAEAATTTIPVNAPLDEDKPAEESSSLR
nr:hypothetical protein [Tanacetum cinerariifolium]